MGKKLFERPVKVGIGFATGRKNFKRVLRSYIHNWRESGLVEDANVSLNVIVAYDLTYNKTVRSDYTPISKELTEHIDGAIFIGKEDISREKERLLENGIVSKMSSDGIFGRGYAAQRNAVLYMALKNKMDYLIFLDDDEYPVAVTNTKGVAVWGGQQVIYTHLAALKYADITHGYHCGYISPLPYLNYNDVLAERDFRTFIEAISNDILNWEKIKEVMGNGGITYADTGILVEKPFADVLEKNGAKFISGGNLGINLTQPKQIFPFYNPPGARGEDTFLSTCLSERRVVKVPCYTFHDGFSTYHHLLAGVLPISLKFIKADNPEIVRRFYNACVGWVRYKPLLTLITDPENYNEKINIVRFKLKETLPKIAEYFSEPKFMMLTDEFDKYDHNAIKHHRDFSVLKETWAEILKLF